MIDRNARDAFGECIRMFMEDETDAEELFELSANFLDSSDPVVAELAVTLEMSLDDGLFIHDAKKWPKEMWDEVQRYLLLLDSDFQFDQTIRYVWTQWQWLAAGGALAFIVFAMATGVLPALMWLSLPSALLSLYIAKKTGEQLGINPYHHVLTPFDSFSSMKAAYEQVQEVRGFKKIKRARLPQSTDYISRPLTWLGIFLYLVVLPTILILPFQALPTRQLERRVVPTYC